jgi:hypothetical protein
VTTAADCDHGVTCASVAGKATLRHDILKGILRHAIHRAGIPLSLEPTLRRLPGLEAGARSGAPGSTTAGLEARGAILMALGSGLAIVDVSVTICQVSRKGQLLQERIGGTGRRGVPTAS